MNLMNKVNELMTVAKGTVIRNSPHIYLAVGIVSGVAAAVVLAKNHKKKEEYIDPLLNDLEAVKNENIQLEPGEEGSVGEYVVDRKGYIEAARPLVFTLTKRTAQLYGPPLVLGAASLYFIVTSHRVLNSRNKALIGAATMVQAAFREYRTRVVDKYGKEEDERLYTGAGQQKFTSVTVGEDGKQKKEKTVRNVIPENPSTNIYTRVFDETNVNWMGNREFTEVFLLSTERTFNDRYYIHGYVVLNDVLEELGFEKTPEGAVTGWSHHSENRDEYISFGITSEMNNNPGDNRWYLNFNVDGVILDYIGLPRKRD